MYVALLSRCPSVTWAFWATHSTPLCSECRSTWATLILACHSTCLLFHCSSVAQLLGTQASTWCTFTIRLSTRQQCPADIMQQTRCVYLCAASWSISIDVATPTGHLPRSMSQYGDRVMAIFLMWQSLRPAAWLLLLQTDLVHLFLWHFQQLVMWDSTKCIES